MCCHPRLRISSPRLLFRAPSTQILNSEFLTFSYADCHPKLMKSTYPEKNGLNAPVIRLSSVSCLRKLSLPRVGHKTYLPVRKLCLALAFGAFHGRVRARPHNSPQYCQTIRDQTIGIFNLYSLIGRLPGMAVRMPTPINQLFNDESIAVQIIF